VPCPVSSLCALFAVGGFRTFSLCALFTVGGHIRQVAFLAIMSTSVDWSRRRTPKSDDWIYLPTVYPADSYVTMRPRGGRAAAASA